MKNNKLIKSFIFAFSGMVSAFKQERNMKIHFIIMILVVIMSIVLKINTYEWIFCLCCFALVITSELINTAIEIDTNLAMPKININAKLAKDISAGAVLFSVIISVIIGFIIFLPKILLLFK